MSNIPEDPILPVRCRTEQGLWFIVALVGAMGLFFLIGPFLAHNNPSSRNPPSTLEVVGIFAMSLLMAALFLWLTVQQIAWLLRREITADETGLRWRNVRTWHHATWQQVRDYYFCTLGSQTSKVETENGALEIPAGQMKNVADLHAAIQQHAQWAKAKEWEVLGTRIETDWPRTFKYHAGERLNTVRFTVGLALFWVVGFLWISGALWQMLVDVWQYSGLLMTLVGGFFFLMVAMLAPFIAWTSIETLKEVRSRSDERITVTPSGLIFEDDTRRIECNWSEIRDYYRDPMLGWQPYDDRYIIVTPEDTFDFTLIERNLLLKKIIQKYATNAPFPQWRANFPQKEGAARVYNYRTRMNRTMLLLPMIFIVLCTSIIIAPISIASSNSGPADVWFNRIFMGSYVLVSILICGTYFAGSIEITEDGIRQRGLRGKKFIAWQDVTQLRRSKMGGYELVGRDTRLGFYGLIGDVETLREEITRRAVNAEIAPSWLESKVR